MTTFDLTAQFIFLASAVLIAHTYIIYPVVLFLLYSISQVKRDWQYLKGRHDRRAAVISVEQLPGVSFIVPVYNEENRLQQKIANLQAVDYPAEKVEVIFVSDGSTDGTNEILKSLPNPRWKAVLLDRRGGKATALNKGIADAHHDILVLSDSSTLIAPEAVRHLVRRFRDPRVGVACACLDFQGGGEFEQTEGVYWRFESILRLMEARLGATLPASGPFFAMRRQAYLPLTASTLIDDFVIAMNARRLGFRVVHDPEAVATDFAASSVTKEFTRRVRLATGSFRALRDIRATPLPGFTAVAFFSHKLLRWVLPFLFIALFLSSAWLWPYSLYRAAFAAQLIVYAWAGVGFLFHRKLQRVRYALLAYFVMTINLAFLVGFVRFLKGRSEGTWQRVN